MTKGNEGPLPLIPELFTVLRGAKYFTKIDLRNAYNLVCVRKGDEYPTAFKTPWGLFEYRVMPFGLKNAPAIFQGLMNDLLYDMLDQFVVIYLDEILIFSENEVLQRLQENHLYRKLEKCEFHKEKVEFLSFEISKQGIEVTKDKANAIQDWPTPLG